MNAGRITWPAVAWTAVFVVAVVGFLLGRADRDPKPRDFGAAIHVADVDAVLAVVGGYPLKYCPDDKCPVSDAEHASAIIAAYRAYHRAHDAMLTAERVVVAASDAARNVGLTVGSDDQLPGCHVNQSRAYNRPWYWIDDDHGKTTADSALRCFRIYRKTDVTVFP